MRFTLIEMVLTLVLTAAATYWLMFTYVQLTIKNSKDLLEKDIALYSNRALDYIEEILNAYTPTSSADVANDYSTSSVKDRRIQLEALSKRELEVLQLICLGKTNNEIAEQLFIAKATVKFHVSNILSKLNVTNRTLAVATARNSGLVR